MSWWRPSSEIVELVPEEIGPPRIEMTIDSVGKTLDALRGDEFSLETEITQKTERLRHTRVEIAAFVEAQRILKEGASAPTASDHVEIDAVADTDGKIGRLVPRQIKDVRKVPCGGTSGGQVRRRA